MATIAKSPVAQIAAWSTKPPALPNSVRDIAHKALIDTVGVSLAGGLEPAPRLLVSTVLQYSAEGPSTLLAMNERSGPALAALVNGTAAHALDYDDVSAAYDGHPSAPVLPAALSVAEAKGVSGEALLDAFAIGLEATSALGAALGHENYRRGFHTTSIVGSVGAAVAAGILYELDEVALRRAIGIAASHACGLKKNVGTMTKPLHAGLAARAGVEAAELAAAGFTADEDVFSGPIGMFAVFEAPDSQLPLPSAEPGGEWMLVRPGISVKKYPCCYMLAWSLDAALALKEEGIEPEQIQGIEVVVQPGGTSALIHDRPGSGLEGKFSLPYSIAAALVDGNITLATFTDRAVKRPEVQSLMDRIEYQEVPDPDSEAGEGFSVVERGYAQVRLRMRSGEEREVFVRTPQGAPGQPLTRQELDAKFLDTAGAALGRDGAATLLDRLWHLPEAQEVRDVLHDVV
jgi:2-methylcitrate dehydratase PrpD